MISKEEYRNLKAYYDYQRLREYNKEKLRERINQLLEQFDDEEDFDRPIPWGWVPKDPKWRLWNE